MPGAAADTDLADDGENQILGGDALRQLAIDVDRQCLRATLQQALRGQHMTDFRRADAEGQRTECAMRCRVAVTTDNRLAGLGGAEFRTDDVHDAALSAGHVEQLDAELAAVVFELLDLLGGRFHRIGTRPNICVGSVGVE